MDREIGRVIDRLRATGALENTLVLFLSDNGASGEIMVRGDGHDPLAQWGATFLSIGPGWSTLYNTPFRRHKTWFHEGGICTPLAVRLITHPRMTRARIHPRDTVFLSTKTVPENGGFRVLRQISGKAAPGVPRQTNVL